MRFRSLVFVGATLLALTPAVGSAQDRLWHINFGGGPTFQAGDLGDAFATGWGPAIGVTVDAPNRKIGFQFEYAYRYFNVADSLPIGATKFSANQQTQQLDFNIVANLSSTDSPVRVYVLGGPGAYYRKVEITEYVGTGIICDPYYYVCGYYPVSDVVGSRGGWDFGFDAGGGVGIRIGESSEFYIESRLHYVVGEDVKPQAVPVGGQTLAGGSTTGYYYPLTFGFRF